MMNIVHSHNPTSYLLKILMHRLIIEVHKIVEELIGAIADIQIRLEELEENSHPPVDWEEIVNSNVERIEYLERKLIERDPK